LHGSKLTAAERGVGESRLFEARAHASEAKNASKGAIDDAVKAFKDFAASL
jgi:hypothetical protein